SAERPQKGGDRARRARREHAELTADAHAADLDERVGHRHRKTGRAEEVGHEHREARLGDSLRERLDGRRDARDLGHHDDGGAGATAKDGSGHAVVREGRLGEAGEGGHGRRWYSKGVLLRSLIQALVFTTATVAHGPGVAAIVPRLSEEAR